MLVKHRGVLTAAAVLLLAGLLQAAGRAEFVLRFFFVHVRHAMTTPVFFLMLAGVFHAHRIGRRDPKLLLVLISWYFAFTPVVFTNNIDATRGTRYFLAFLAIGCLLAARFCTDMLKWERHL